MLVNMLLTKDLLLKDKKVRYNMNLNCALLDVFR